MCRGWKGRADIIISYGELLPILTDIARIQSRFVKPRSQLPAKGPTAAEMAKTRHVNTTEIREFDVAGKSQNQY
jgi:hypothetical protein